MIFTEQDPRPPEALVPPRPNLGPEPWPDRPSWSSGFTICLVIFALSILVVLWLWRSKRSAKKRPGAMESMSELIEVDPSPRRRLIANFEKVRGALIEEFGTSWGSKTTEEIIKDERLTDWLAPGEIEKLVGFLRLSDRAKFADDDLPALDDWESWAETFVAGLATRPAPGPAMKS